MDAEKKLADGKSEIEKNEKDARRWAREVRVATKQRCFRRCKAERGVESVGGESWPQLEKCACAKSEQAVATLAEKSG